MLPACWAFWGGDWASFHGNTWGLAKRPFCSKSALGHTGCNDITVLACMGSVQSCRDWEIWGNKLLERYGIFGGVRNKWRFEWKQSKWRNYLYQKLFCAAEVYNSSTVCLRESLVLSPLDQDWWKIVIIHILGDHILPEVSWRFMV